MRLLFTMPPGLGHLFPLVPLARANISAGNHTLVATSGATLHGAVGAGLQAVDVAPEETVGAPYNRLGEAIVDRTRSTEDLVGEVFDRFGELSAMMLDGLVDVGHAWRADAVVYPPACAAGLIAARALGIPAVLHGFGVRRSTLVPSTSRLTEAASRHGVTTLPQEPDVEVNVSPESLEDMPTTGTLAMRYGSYQGGAVLPPWLFSEDAPPRVAVTLGSMASTVGRGELLREVLRGAADLGVELVVTTAGMDLPALPRPLPEHVRLIDWLPLGALLPTCSAIVHHGGSGSTFAALASSVPQLVIPHGGDRSDNAAVIRKRGVGVTLEMEDVTSETVADALHDLLGEPSYKTASDEVAAEMLTMPTPLSVASRLAGRLASRASAPL